MTVRPAEAADGDAIAELLRLADYIVPFAIRTACDLGLADLLTDGPRPVAELAEETGTHPPSLHRLLRALASTRVFAEVAPGVFGLTPLAEPLRSDHPLSLRDAYPLLPADIRALGRTGHTLRTGEAAFDLLYGRDYWAYLGANPEEGAAVDRWMESLNRLHLRTVLSAYDWSGARTVVDVGGGNGAFLAGLLSRHRDARGVLLDLPHVVAAAPALLSEAGLAGRCEVVPGSFFDSVPTGADLYVLKTVLPGWPDEPAERILRNVRAAMRRDSRLVLLEAIIPDGDGFDVAKLVDVHTMVLTGGRHRDRHELGRLLARAGLELLRAVPTPTLTLLEARPNGTCPTPRQEER
ncbi:methyltransferase [Sphaerimonospora mesophila]|uniref:methyltransferase n=1 Tax=Sphaerimonospora mesophila TaxID=37483 RepID=UPI0006E45CB7